MTDLREDHVNKSADTPAAVFEVPDGLQVPVLVPQDGKLPRKKAEKLRKKRQKEGRHGTGKAKRKWWIKLLIGIGIALASLILLIVLFFLTVFYTPLFPEYRDQYILMTYRTSNPWLCTWFFSQEAIDDAFARNAVIPPKGETDPGLIVINPEDDPAVTEPEPKAFAVSEKYAGEIIYEDKGIQVTEFSGKTRKGKYTARLIQVLDPSRVFLGLTDKMGDKDHPSSKPGKGQIITDMCETNDALCGINAGGFMDVGGVGSGGIPTEIVVKDGVITTFNKNEKHAIIGFNEDNVLVLGEFTNEEIIEHRIRDAMSWTPILILNGEKASISGLAGGFDPRSAIGQRADGTVLLLVVDGSLKRSIDGANMELLMDILWEYGAVNASNLDGGTSSSMALEGEIINSVCNPAIASRGRYLATAWLVANLPEDSAAKKTTTETTAAEAVATTTESATETTAATTTQ